MIFSISVVCAEENITLAQSYEYTFSVENPSETLDAKSGLETTQSNMDCVKDELDTGVLLLQKGDDNNLGDNVGSFSDLRAILNSAEDGSTIVLDRDYRYMGSTDINGIRINFKSLTIIGNNHSIDGNNQAQIFIFAHTENDFNLINITFCNAYSSSYGGAISFIGSSRDHSYSVVDCIFVNNSAASTGAVALFIMRKRHLAK